MRHLGRLFGMIVVAGAAWCLSGCGGNSIEEGMPQNIDMTKDYTPAANKDMMIPGDIKKAAKANRPKGAPSIP